MVTDLGHRPPDTGTMPAGRKDQAVRVNRVNKRVLPRRLFSALLVAGFLAIDTAAVVQAWQAGPEGVAGPKLVACVVAGATLAWTREPLQAMCTLVGALAGARGGLLTVEAAHLHGFWTLMTEVALSAVMSALFCALTHPAAASRRRRRPRRPFR